MTEWFTKQEQAVILFLLFSLILGAGIKTVRERRLQTDPDWEAQKAELLQEFQERSAIEPVKTVVEEESAEKKLQAKKRLTQKIDLNRANEEQLQSLPKIGPAMAARIIEYRNKVGRFQNIEEIQQVKGIGPKTFEIIRDYITVQ